MQCRHGKRAATKPAKRVRNIKIIMFCSWFKKSKGARDAPLTDPVCGMRVTDEITRAHKGKLIAFCSVYCRERFEKNPKQYLTQ